MLRYWTQDGIVEGLDHGLMLLIRHRWFLSRVSWPEALVLCESLVFWSDRCYNHPSLLT